MGSLPTHIAEMTRVRACGSLLGFPADGDGDESLNATAKNAGAGKQPWERNCTLDGSGATKQ